MQIACRTEQRRLPTRAERKKAKALFQHGVNLHNAGQIEQAISAYLDAVVFLPDHSDALNNLAVALMTLDRHSEAVDVWKRVVRLLPEEVDASAGMIWALISDGRPSEALLYLDTARKQFPADLRLTHLTGHACLKMGLLGPAIGAFYLVLDADPENHGVHTCLALALFDDGKIEQALHHGRKAFYMMPTATQATWFSCVLIEQRCFDEALVVVEQGIILNPGSRELLSNRARALQGLDRHTDAIKAWRSALKAAPDNSLIQQSLAASLSAAFEANVVGHA